MRLAAALFVLAYLLVSVALAAAQDTGVNNGSLGVYSGSEPPGARPASRRPARICTRSRARSASAPAGHGSASRQS
jgi:hypothetical protein